jgi:hypothetical protein
MLDYILLRVINKLKKTTMSKIKQSPFGGVSGGFGNLMGSSWKGIPYIRVKPAVYHDAKTEDKVAHLYLFFKNEQVDLYSESCYQMIQF